MLKKLMNENSYKIIVEDYAYEYEFDKNRIVEVIKLTNEYIFNVRYLTNLENKIKDEIVKTFRCDTIQDLNDLIRIYK